MKNNLKTPEIIGIATEFLQAVTKELDPYTKQKGIIIEESSIKTILLTPSHIQFAKYGRGPGKKPPLDPILKWVKEGNIQFRDKKGRFTSHRSTAFAIQNSIGKKGTLNYKKNAPNAIEEAILKNYSLYSSKVGELMSIQVNQQVGQTLKQILPGGKMIYKI